MYCKTRKENFDNKSRLHPSNFSVTKGHWRKELRTWCCKARWNDKILIAFEGNSNTLRRSQREKAKYEWLNGMVIRMDLMTARDR